MNLNIISLVIISFFAHLQLVQAAESTVSSNTSCDLSLNSLRPSAIDFEKRFDSVLNDDGKLVKKGPESNFSQVQTYVIFEDQNGNRYSGIIQGVKAEDITNKSYKVQIYSDNKGHAVATLNRSEFVVAPYNNLMQSLSHNGSEFKVSDLEFTPSNNFRNPKVVLIHARLMYLQALRSAGVELAIQREDKNTLKYLGEEYDKIQELYFQHFPELKLLGSLKVPINENITTSDHARSVFSNLLVMISTLQPILYDIDLFSPEDVYVSLLSFGFNHDFLKAAVAPVAGRAYQDQANFPFRRFIEPSLLLSNSIVEFGIHSKWNVFKKYFTNWETDNKDFIRDDSNNSVEKLLQEARQVLENAGFEATESELKAFFWFSLIAEMADGTGYGLQNTYTMLVLYNGGPRALIPAADLLKDRASGKVNSFFLEVMKAFDPKGYKKFIEIFGINSDGFATKAVLSTSDNAMNVFNP